ncbi:MarR family transcriptional regulator [Embleya scabrispora]|uniref:MarR family transcriptional regulator n=1 Tax=Embleya scabrispora TaxID=159449 RepID=A0A1T3NQF0_9ACTN|nr:MarR family winged helix-turn-helix transcriptional regulator [Embleya scabrispora]OPC79026.1 MarR family transcriptional regulator [Embleya scabrispora]
MDETTPPTLTALSTYLLSRVGKAARNRLGEQLALRGLRLWHTAVLAALADFGAHAQRDLAARLGIHASDVVKVLDELTAAGWVERTRDAADRRRVRVTLTPAGRAALAEQEAAARAVQEEILTPLNAEERVLLHDFLLRMHHELPLR